jgi:hypothetical protein
LKRNNIAAATIPDNARLSLLVDTVSLDIQTQPPAPLPLLPASLRPMGAKSWAPIALAGFWPLAVCAAVVAFLF